MNPPPTRTSFPHTLIETASLLMILTCSNFVDRLARVRSAPEPLRGRGGRVRLDRQLRPLTRRRLTHGDRLGNSFMRPLRNGHGAHEEKHEQQASLQTGLGHVVKD